MNIQVSHNIDDLRATLARYIEASGKTVDEVLDKKGRDLGIKLYQGFRDRRFGGGVKGWSFAAAELAARTAAGRGTAVRPSLVKEYIERKGQVSRLADRKYAQLTARGLTKEQRRELRRIRSATKVGGQNLWRSYVGREIRLRARGSGVLAASFLWFRRRFVRGSFGKEVVFRRNRTARPLGWVEKTPGALRITAVPLGMDVVESRYGIVRGAVAAAIADMEAYVSRKYREAYERAARSSGGGS